MKIDLVIAEYIFRFYSHLLNEEEQAIYRYRLYAGKEIIKILKTLEANNELESKNPIINLFVKNLITNDEKIEDVIENHWENFMLQTAERVIKDSLEQIYFNLCPQCGQLARTPQAKQCRCGCQWREKNLTR